jgi:hypothetical protein
MTLVHRNCRAYLYRSLRRGGRVTSEYVGSGIDAPLIADLEADERHKRNLAAITPSRSGSPTSELRSFAPSRVSVDGESTALARPLRWPFRRRRASNPLRRSA